MTTLARLSFQVSLERRDSVESLYEGQLAPILERHGLVATTAPGRPAATETNPHGYWICSRLFAVDSPELIPGYDQALREDPAWQQAVRLPIHTYRLDVYQTPAGPGKTVPSGPGQASSAGPGTPVEVGSGFRQGLWRSFGLRDGMPECIADLIQDQHGNLWFATRAWGASLGRGQGLWRFDGARLYALTATDGLPHEAVTCLLEDPDGRLWIGTEGAGLSRYDGQTFTTYTTDDGLAGNVVGSLLADREGRVWIGTAEGVSCYDGQAFTTYTTEDGLAHNRVACMLEDRAGQLWFGSGWAALGGGGVSCFDGATFTHYTEAEGLSSDWVLSLLQDRSGKVWFGTNNSVSCFDGQSFHRAFITDSSQHLGGVTAILEDQSGHLWFAIWGEGVRRRDGASHVSFTPQHDLTADTVTSLLEDRAGHVWVGTRGGGVNQHSGHQLATFAVEEGLGHSAVTSLREDRQGLLWAATSRGVSVCHGLGFEVLDGTAGQAATCLQDDRRGHVWFGLPGTGVGRWNGECVEIITPEGGPLDLHSLQMAPLLEDRSGRLWFATGGDTGGLSYYDGEGWTPFAVDIRQAPQTVHCMLEDHAGRLWFGGHEGASRYDGQQVELFTTDEGLPHNEVHVLLEDGSNQVWIGTAGGLSRYDGTALASYAIGVGLSHSDIRALLEDSAGRLWIGTSGGGMNCCDGLVFQHLSRKDGLADDSVSQILQDRKGDIWIGTGGGLSRYTPSQIPPKVQLRAVIADQHYEPVDALAIPASQKLVLFEFQGSSWTTPREHLVYVCRLEGHDDAWKPVYGDRIEYSDLPVGDYAFQVRAVDRDLNYSEVAAVALTVEPDTLVAGLTEALRQSGPQGDFVGTSQALRLVQQQLRQIAPNDLTALILGETGTGKGLAARYLHQWSARADGPFIPVNCGAMPEALIESELFGHEKGAFTGAHSRKLGKVELAKRGTLFLDEIGDLPLASQVKFLRLLEECHYERVGGTQILQADVRVVAATNRDLKQMVAEERFRADLYFRLEVLPIHLPPLRQRGDDVELLALYFLKRQATHLGKSAAQFAPAALARLQNHHWPGNVRELEHVIQRAVLECEGAVIQAADLGLIREPGGTGQTAVGELTPEEYERQYTLRILEQTRWVIAGPNGAAAALGLHEATLRHRMKKLGLQRPSS